MRVYRRYGRNSVGVPGWFAAGTMLFAFLIYLCFWFAVICLALAVIALGGILWVIGTLANKPKILSAGQFLIGAPAVVVEGYQHMQDQQRRR